MTIQELQDIVLRNTSEISVIRGEISDLLSKEKRVEAAMKDLGRRLGACLSAFDRDGYKSTDQRLLIAALANEVLIFEKLGYNLGLPGASFLLGVAALLEGRNQFALDQFSRYISTADSTHKNLSNANYLAGMICYNRRQFAQAIEFYQTAFRLSPEANRDWQSRIYVAELYYFDRRPKDVIEKLFFEVEDSLKWIEGKPHHDFLRATLYLKLGNCYVATFLEPEMRNQMVNNPKAIDCYKQARKWCPRRAETESLLPIVIDYSLVQALLIEKSIDMDLSQTPSELLADVFHRLRRIVLTKREEIILAQTYFMLGTCAFYSTHISKDVGEIYLEYARHQTLSVPSDVCFYSCITKELLKRDDFVEQIDYYANQVEWQEGRR